MCTVRRSRAARAAALGAAGGDGIPLQNALSSAAALWPRRVAEPRPSKRWMKARSASHSRTAFSASVSNTGCRSNVDRPITLSSSLVAVCCSSATRSSRFRASSSSNRRTFWMAITAWSPKVFRSSTWPAANSPALEPLNDDDSDRGAVGSNHRDPEQTPPLSLDRHVLRILRVGPHVRDLRHGSVQDRPPGHLRTGRPHRVRPPAGPRAPRGADRDAPPDGDRSPSN